MIRLCAQEAVQNIQRGFRLALLPQRAGQIVKGLGIAGVQFEVRAQGLGRFLELLTSKV